MQFFFVEIKCKLGKTYQVASALADRQIFSRDHSTDGSYDILAKFHVDDGLGIGHFVAENVQTIPEIQDTRTIITFKRSLSAGRGRCPSMKCWGGLG